MMSHDALSYLRGVADEWFAHEWIRALDRAMVDFLLRSGETNAAMLALAMLTSHQAGRGLTSLKLDDLKTSPERCLALPPTGRIHDVTTPSQLLSELGVFDTDWRTSVTLKGDDPSSSPLVLTHNSDGERLYLRRYWYCEHYNNQNLTIRMENHLEVNEDQLNQTLDALFGASTEALDWQRIACANAARSGFSVITGGPGTGKTYTVVRLLVALQQQFQQTHGRLLRIKLAAPTGKAAARLSESINQALSELQNNLPKALQPLLANIQVEASTVHKLLGVIANSRRYRHHDNNPVRADLIVIDEASMLDIEMMTALLQAAPIHAQLVLLGDKDQLASVEAGAVLGNLCEGAEKGRYWPATINSLVSNTIQRDALANYQDESGPKRLQHVVMLRQTRRFEQAIAEVANAINEQDIRTIERLSAAPMSDHESSIVTWLMLEHDHQNSFDALIKQGFSHYLTALEAWREAPAEQRDTAAVLKAYGTFQLLTGLRNGPWGAHALNRYVGDVLGVEADRWYEGRPVMVTKNDYGLRLNNGDIGLTFRMPETGQMRVAFSDVNGKIKWVLPSRLNHVETVYVMTVHKSQGSEFSHAVLVSPQHDSPVLTKELLYTGVTRAKEKLTLVVSRKSVLLNAVSKKINR
ncbi:exodeoxyribonuclease V subunit alpha [Idiomarina sp.]|uniref:exodeoxyribonuclease V subunit alpha n=1 Tax=Idiomarina sp. TaxID=1874361 RepID=UPI00351602E2